MGSLMLRNRPMMLFSMPFFRLIDGREDAGDDDHRQDVGDVEDDAKKVLAFDLLPGEDGGKYQCKGEGDQGDRYHQQDHILHGADELGVPQQMLEVFKPHKGLVGRIGTRSYKLMRNTLRVGRIIKRKNRMVAGATQRNTNRLRLFIRSHRGIDRSFLDGTVQPKKAEAVKTAPAGQGLITR